MKNLLILILVIAAILRFGGIYPGHNIYHADEPIIYGTAVNMLKSGNLDPGRYDYPATTIFINFVIFKIIFVPLFWIKYLITNVPSIVDGLVSFDEESKKRILNTAILGNRNVNALFWSRTITAIFSLGNVLIIYLVGKEFYNKQVGLIAALLLAFNFKHVVNSHLALPEPYNSFFLLLSLFMSLRLLKVPTQKNYLLAGLITGLSVATKYQVYALLPLLTAHLLVSINGFKPDFKQLFGRKVIISMLLIPLVFLLLNPYFIINYEVALNWVTRVSLKYQMGRNNINLFLLSYMQHLDYGVPMLLAVLFGLIIAPFKKPKKTLVILGPILLFTFLFFYYSNGGFYVRNLVTITPFLLLFASVLIWEVYLTLNKILDTNVSLALMVSLVLLTIYLPAKNSLIHAYYYTKPWNYTSMTTWLQENLPENAVIAATLWDLPTGEPKRSKTEFSIHGSYSLAEHRENGADWALWNFNSQATLFYFWMSIGVEDLGKLWNKPINYLENTYHGLAVEEMVRHSPFIAAKPGIASDHTLIIAKIPKWPITDMVRAKSFTFDNNWENWKIVGSSLRGGPTSPADSSIVTSSSQNVAMFVLKT